MGLKIRIVKVPSDGTVRFKNNYNHATVAEEQINRILENAEELIDIKTYTDTYEKCIYYAIIYKEKEE